MTDPSADRPLLLPEDVRGAVASALEAANAATWEAGRPVPDWNALASAALVALAARSLLLPPSAEHREEEFTVEYVHPMDREYRRQRMEPCMDTLAEITEYAAGLRDVGYIDVKTYRRTRAVDAGRWVEVDRSTTDATS